jgi:hypothetical protein
MLVFELVLRFYEPIALPLVSDVAEKYVFQKTPLNLAVQAWEWKGDIHIDMTS